MPIAPHVIEHVASEHGVCLHPVPLRRIDPDTGSSEVMYARLRRHHRRQVRTLCEPSADSAWPNAGRAGTPTKSQSSNPMSPTPSTAGIELSTLAG